jgi:hypothetical protein
MQRTRENVLVNLAARKVDKVTDVETFRARDEPEIA